MADKFEGMRINIVKIASKAGKFKCRTELVNLSLSGLYKRIKQDVDLADNCESIVSNISKYKYLILCHDEESILYVKDNFEFVQVKNLKLWFDISDIISHTVSKPLQIHDVVVNDKLKQTELRREVISGAYRLQLMVIDHDNVRTEFIKRLDALEWLEGIVGVYYRFLRDDVVIIMLNNDSCSVGVKLKSEKIISMKLSETKYGIIRDALTISYLSKN